MTDSARYDRPQLPAPLAPPLPVLLAERAARDPGGVLIECVDGGGYTNAAFHAAALRFARGLRELGIGPGDRVAVMLDATPLAHVCWIGTAWLRAWEVPVNTDFRGSSLQHALADSGAVVLVTTNALAMRADALREAFPQLRTVITTDAEPPATGIAALTLAEVMSHGELGTDDPPRELDPYAVIYTSGTTGPSKGFPMAVADPDVPGTCGVLSPLYEARIVDEDDFELPDGEVVIRSHLPWLMLRCYLGRWEATAKAWRNGWFHTGDALRRDAAGNYFFVDRVADYLRTRGNNVSSLEVEAEVRTHPAVADCACIGVPADLEGDDDIKLVVTRAEGSALTAGDLYAYLEPRMPRYQLPRYIQFAAELPRTPTGKVRKGELRASGTAGDSIWDRTGAEPSSP
jgi:acyl-CoA synthetase (AMP-forming)/AMP-acid ligase II